LPRYRKKPVVIEAVEYSLQEWADDPLVFYTDGEPVPQWLHDAVESGIITSKFEDEDYWYLYIETLEGSMKVTPGDFIIRGVQGEIYPCKPDIFRATYDPA
jgi:hypothetical protein